jgi:HK97 family phage major capsid protein
MPFDNIVTRGDASDLIPEESAGEIITAATQQSAALQLCRRATMSAKVKTQPVLSVLPSAYWVNGDTGLKQTTEAAWDGIMLTAEEIAVIVPVPQAVFDDAGYNLWDELRDPIGQAFAQLVDAAVFAGTNKPASWPEALIPAAVAAGNVQAQAATVAEGGVLGDLEATLAVVEEDGFEPTAFAAARTLKSQLRRARDASGQPLGDGSTTRAWDLPIVYAVAGTIPPPTLAIAGDWTMAVLGVRQDMTFKVLDQAPITDDTGKVILNLAQQDAIALRVVARYGFAVGVPATLKDVAAPNPYPFAVLQTGTTAAKASSSSKSS